MPLIRSTISSKKSLLKFSLELTLGTLERCSAACAGRNFDKPLLEGKHPRLRERSAHAVSEELTANGQSIWTVHTAFEPLHTNQWVRLHSIRNSFRLNHRVYELVMPMLDQASHKSCWCSRKTRTVFVLHFYHPMNICWLGISIAFRKA